ncbi:hypothetical protein BN1088_1730002 [Sphingobacterium sp. PM2-P1-29]|nr:hypothetical protein BN1088_1730002 [Sphingobacterium sp. PM2-P1-29]
MGFQAVFFMAFLHFISPLFVTVSGHVYFFPKVFYRNSRQMVGSAQEANATVCFSKTKLWCKDSVLNPIIYRIILYKWSSEYI